MKKIITSFLALFLFVGLICQHSVNSVKLVPSPANDNYISVGESMQSLVSKSSFGEACFFLETFSNGFEGDNGVGPFTFEDSGGADPIWMVADENSPCGEFGNPASQALQSTTSSNGWVIFDADCWNTPVSDGVFDVQGFMMSPVIDMSERDDVVVTWEQNFRYCCFGSSPLTLGVSTDGGSSWTEFPAHGSFVESANVFSGNVVTTVDVSSVAANESDVIIRWAYNAPFNAGYSHYFWQIDDICMSTTFDCPDLSLNIGDACDDENESTQNDMISDECVCVGDSLPDVANSFCETALTALQFIIYSDMISDGTEGASNECFNTGAVDATWYEFTAFENGEVVVSSSIDPSLPDTRLSIYSGTCDDLTCIASDDDSGEGFTSIASFTAIEGETYYIEWDDRWGEEPFDFIITNEASECPDIPDDFSESCFFYENFSNGFQGSNGVGPFTTLDSGGSDDPIWMVADENSPCGEFSNPGTQALQSTSACNGWVIFDADCWNTPISDGVFDVQGFMTSPTIDMSDRDIVIVSWEQNFRYCCFSSSPLTLGVSIDEGATWTEFPAQGSFVEAANVFSENITTVVDVSTIAANQPEVQIRWAYNESFDAGYSHYFWQIDDICMYDTYDCPDLQAAIGGPCDDNDVTTTGDTVTEDCGCVGQLANDDCVNAIAIGCNGTVSGSLADATFSSDVPSCDADLDTSPGVWFSFTGTGDLVTASLCDSNYDTRIGVFEGGCSDLDCVASNDDICGQQSSVTFTALQGTSYLIYVSGTVTDSSEYTLSLECLNADCETMLFNSTFQGWQETEVEVTPDNSIMFEPLETTESIVPMNGANEGTSVQGTFIDPRYFVGLDGKFYADFSGPGYNENENWSDWGIYVSLLPASTTENVYDLSGSDDESVLAFRWIGFVDVDGNDEYDSGIDIYLNELDQQQPIPAVDQAGRLFVAFSDRRGQYDDNLGQLLLTYCPGAIDEQNVADGGVQLSDLFKSIDVSEMLDIYPNPSEDEFMIISQVKMSSIEILDVAGRTVSFETINETATESISLGDNLDGVYLIRITYTDGSVSTDRLILQK